jgi:UDP-N-acetylmuramoylalanine--D-glutamate ligase
MRSPDYWKNKRVCIIGLARSGLACASLLSELGAYVSVTDNQRNHTTVTNAAYLESQKNIKIELGQHSPEFIKGHDLVIVSPGVPDSASPIIWAKQSGISLISEIELAGSLCPATVIAVTGTNGKTTVTTLIGKILEAKGRKVFVCGNIGTPFSEEVPKMSDSDFVSLEISSFQLEKILTFKPKIAVILNFSRNHLDRYREMPEYLEAKKRIFMNQDESDYLVLNFDDPQVKELGKNTPAKVIYFSVKEGLNPNQAAVLAVGSLLGIEKELCLRTFREFKGVEHRLELVTEIDGIKFINDSKATTVDSTIWALENLTQPVILIAGGREKGNDYKLISGLMQKKVKELILIGETKEKIKAALGDILSVQEAITLEEAVSKAYSKATRGCCILFSPMCKSFDMFSDYEDRGRSFKQAVYALTKNMV